ncbi:class I SAM-dependent methyltransferase [Nocardioides iriomotensis]|uniref:Class I SAM-dependent methyltransferase n=1 Tax=Nocardioides iriomotensis TaxID=715784 RepID=A0A4Q5J7Z6_9ACTN|nr:class I SAM-dependent methyltransferase [Nocardioides iriomotensis]
MARGSAEVSGERPFYGLFAGAYDALIDDPVEPWVDAVHEALGAAGFGSARVLDAGCGTGRHAAALVDRGHAVTLLDASPALLRVAAQRCPDAPVLLTDLCSPAVTATFDAVVSRGVLNDLLTDRERADAVSSFARLTRRVALAMRQPPDLDEREDRGRRALRAHAWPSRRSCAARVHLPDATVDDRRARRHAWAGRLSQHRDHGWSRAQSPGPPARGCPAMTVRTWARRTHSTVVASMVSRFACRPIPDAVRR